MKPGYVKVNIPSGKNYISIKNNLMEKNLHTVCQEARCPNIAECWDSGTATFMILGSNCSRGCRFCSVTHGGMLPVDPEEPAKVRDSVIAMNLKYAVITSVDRDDLTDQGSVHYSRVIKEVRMAGVLVEALIPDFTGREDLLENILQSNPDVLAHNVETVRRLTPMIRDHRANYEQSLKVLKYFKERNNTLITKSSIMLGHGELDHEVEETMDDLRSVGVDILTIGQYLRPSKRQIEVTEYCSMERFKMFEKIGYEKGFSFVASGPLVRTSYKAAEAWASRRLIK
ncbi:MAG: lipoyl synthase [Candidatus Thermoplasmatota archaeon]|nr:lipoyl synthase [Candidatus Thermoplasmatota archaeon]MCL5787850.1 lipoyl synthase [Candidatus Thermoplasmatota archaeon]